MIRAVCNTTLVTGAIAVGVIGFLGLSGCAPEQKAQQADFSTRRELVYPPPPDPPRFVFERAIYSSADVAPPKEDALRRALVGDTDRFEGLAKPYAVAVHRGKIYVSDSADRFVKVFDVPGGKYYKIGDDDVGPLMKPLGLDVDAGGNVYVADATQKVVMVYNPEGKFLRKIGHKMFERLSSVTVDPAGQRLYVVDIGGVSSDKHYVRVFDSATGVHLHDIGKRGTGPGEFNLPRDVSIGKNGQIYVVDGGNFRVQVFDRNGKYLQTFGAVGKQLGNFARPKEIAHDPDGNVYVVDAAFGNFQIFSAEGDLLMYIGDRSERGGAGQYMLPSGIAVDEDGRVYMVDQWFKKIDVFRPYGLAAEAGYLGLKPRVGGVR